jgi:hypothetical protein
MTSRSRPLPAACHFQPIELLFHLMKSIVSDLVVGTHVEHRVACRLDGRAVNLGAGGTLAAPWCRIRVRGSEMRRELLPECIGHCRLVNRKARQSSMQGAFARGRELAANRIVVVQVERAE